MSPAPFSVVFVGAGEVRSARKREEKRFASPMLTHRMTPARSTLVRRKDHGTTRNALKSTSSSSSAGLVESCADLRLLVDSRFGPLLAVLGIIDPDVTRAEAQIAAKNNAGVPGYAGAAVWPTPEAAGQALAADAAAGIDLVIVGAPPHFRGCVRPPADLDLRLIAALPQTRRWLVEKPVSAAPPTESNGQEQVARAYKDTGAVVGAGYMMCALKGVQMIQEMIKAKGLKVMGTAARVSYSLALCCKTHMLTSDRAVLHGLRVRTQAGVVEQANLVRS